MIFGVGERFLSGIKNINVRSEACVGISEIEGEWFNINSRMRKRFVMTSCLFNL